jgi:hypothetical protein
MRNHLTRGASRPTRSRIELFVNSPIWQISRLSWPNPSSESSWRRCWNAGPTHKPPSASAGPRGLPRSGLSPSRLGYPPSGLSNYRADRAHGSHTRKRHFPLGPLGYTTRPGSPILPCLGRSSPLNSTHPGRHLSRTRYTGSANSIHSRARSREGPYRHMGGSVIRSHRHQLSSTTRPR